MGMGGPVLQTRYIGHPQAELLAASGYGTGTISGADSPEHVGPLGIAGQERHLGGDRRLRCCGGRWAAGSSGKGFCLGQHVQ